MDNTNNLKALKDTWGNIYAEHGTDVPWSHQGSIESGLPVIVKFLKERKVSSLLDYGAGSGHFAVALKEALLIPRVFAADITDGGADKKWLQQKGIEFILANQPKEVGKEKFDAILCWSVLNHLNRDLREAFLGQFAEMLTDRGSLLISAHSSKDPRMCGDVSLNRFSNRTVYSMESFENEIEKHGFLMVAKANIDVKNVRCKKDKGSDPIRVFRYCFFDKK